jgi:hypothetical protein
MVRGKAPEGAPNVMATILANQFFNVYDYTRPCTVNCKALNYNYELII